jgi:hypothetical protein
LHKQSQKHVTNLQSKKGTLQISKFFSKPKEANLDDQVAEAEVRLTAFMAEHSVPFIHVDHLIDCCKKIFPGSNIAQRMKLKRSKASSVMQYGIAHNERQHIVSICRNQKFSVIIDDSTDVSVTQILAVVVRYFDFDKSQVVDSLFDLVEVEDSSSDGLFTAFSKLMTDNAIPFHNIVGFASDNCATMMGSHSGFQAKLRHIIPNVFVIGCVCHSFALCANAASKRLPSWLEAFVKNVCFHFSKSSKRNVQFQLIQDVVQSAKHRVLKLCETRWLSRQAVLERILEQWDALKVFFQSETATDKVDGAGNIFQQMTTVGTKHMLLFVAYVLAKVNSMSLEFQAENFRLHKLYSTIVNEYRCLFALFVREDVLNCNRISDIDPNDQNVWKPLKSIELGGRCQAQLIRQPLGDKEIQFRQC